MRKINNVNKSNQFLKRLHTA